MTITFPFMRLTPHYPDGQTRLSRISFAMPPNSSPNSHSTLNGNPFVRSKMIDNFADAELPDQLIAFKYPLPRLSAALRAKGPLRIVAMGSSSTAGREDVVPYPHRLEMYLRVAADNPGIDVLNRGRGGEEATEELPRFDTDIFAE